MKECNHSGNCPCGMPDDLVPDDEWYNGEELDTRHHDSVIDVCCSCGEVVSAQYSMGRYDFEVTQWPVCPVCGVVESDEMYELIHDTAASYYAGMPGSRDYTPKGGY